jgi:hypothetical protein
MFDPILKYDIDALKISVTGPSIDEVRMKLMKAFTSDVENKIRAALVEMGWTPPEDAETDECPLCGLTSDHDHQIE